MPLDAPVLPAGWRARLALDFERRGARTVLAHREHDGPLVVQKALYPEGEETCHAIVVHPPGGIAGGDQLTIDVRASQGAAAFLTTPGAAKWYRSSGAWATQRVALHAAPSCALEWLPQETILYDASLADMAFDAHLEGDARLIAWDITCLGRRGSGERYASGQCRTQWRIHRDERLQWHERARLGGDEAVMASHAGLGGASVFAMVVVAAPTIEDRWLARAREVCVASGIAGVTRLPGVLLARYRGDAAEDARAYCAGVWSALRLEVMGRAAVAPRIWST